MEITETNISSQAWRREFYDFKNQKWEKLNWLEALLRIIFGTILPCLIDGMVRSCERRSWGSVAKMDQIPQDIAVRIDTLFRESMYRTNPISQFARPLAKIFLKVTVANYHDPLPTFTIKESRESSRLFQIFQNDRENWKVDSSDYGKLDFYAGEDQCYSNYHDSLRNQVGNQVAGIQLACDYPKIASAMKISPLYGDRVYVESTRDTALLYFERNREIIAIAFKEPTRKIHWEVTLLDPKSTDDDTITLLWAVLKFSQHYHFREPYYYTMPSKGQLNSPSDGSIW